MDAVQDIASILGTSVTKESYKDALLADIRESSFGDAYLDTLPAKIEQLYENSAQEILVESSVGQLNPIVGLTLPVL